VSGLKRSINTEGSEEGGGTPNRKKGDTKIRQEVMSDHKGQNERKEEDSGKGGGVERKRAQMT